MIEESGKAILARKRAKHDEVAASVFEAAADHIVKAKAKSEPEALLWMVPAQHEPLVPLPPERRERFREHLDFCATLAFREPEETADLAAVDKTEPEDAPLSVAVCTTCQGRCCKNMGGDTALLLPADFGRYRLRTPGVSAAEVIDAYLSYLPEVSTQDGCVYLGAQGCALPREMRDDICNSYFCDSLRWLRMAEKESGTSAAVLVAAHDGVPERIAVVASDGSRQEIANLVEEPE